MVATPINSKRAELFADRRKIYLRTFVILFLLFSLWFAIDFVSKDKSHFVTDIVLTLIFYGYFARERLRLLFRSPHLRLYENGIDFQGLGFCEWEEMECTAKGHEIIFFIKCEGRNFPKGGKKVGARRYIYNKQTNRLTVEFLFPNHSSNIPVPDFFKKMVPYLPNEKQEHAKVEHGPPPSRLDVLIKQYNEKSLKEFWFGTEDTSSPTFWINLFLLVAMALFFVTLLNAPFFPSDMWHVLGNKIIFYMAAILTIIAYVGRLTGKIKSTVEMTKTKTAIGLVTMPFVLWGLLWFSVYIGFGNVYTELFGKEYSVVETVSKIEKGEIIGLFCDKTSLKSKALNTDYINVICLQRSAYKSAPNTFELRLYGKRSWFGFLARKYRVLTDDKQQ